MGRALSKDPYSTSFDWEAEKDREFGEWLTMRRKKACLTIDKASVVTRMSIARLTELEKGDAYVGITKKEAQALAQPYGLDYRAIMLRAINGF